MFSGAREKVAGAREKAVTAAENAVDRARAASAEARTVINAGVAEAKTTAKEKLDGAVQSGKDMAVSLSTAALQLPCSGACVT